MHNCFIYTSENHSDVKGPEQPHFHPLVPISSGLHNLPPFKGPEICLFHKYLVSLTRWVAVEGKEVGSASGEAGDGVSGGKSLDASAELLGTGEALKAGQVSTETGNMGRGHRGTGDGVLKAANVSPCR